MLKTRLGLLDAMLKKVASWLSILWIVASLCVVDGYIECNCDDNDAFWSMDTILFVQRAGDLGIAVAYFSIPIEIMYFVSCCSFPFKWVLFQFGAFIVFCGLTHFLTFLAQFGQFTFQLVLALIVCKILTASVSILTAVTLMNLIPLLLKAKTREFMLKRKNRDLDREVGEIKQKEEAGMHVRMLTHEIRKSLDRHTILYTTLVELSKLLSLQNCVIWMPNENSTEMKLTHDTTRENVSSMYNMPIPIIDRDVREIKESDAVKILDSGSRLAAASSRGSCDPETVAAIRIPMLVVSNFRGETPEIVPQCYAILVLVQPSGCGRIWRNQEIEIVRAAADQVAVALSHAAVVEESQHMRDRLMEQNRALHKAREDALRASQARSEFQTVMNHRLRRPMHSILGMLSVLQEEKSRAEQQQQRLIVDSIIKTSNVLSTLMDDVIATSTKDNLKFPLEMKHFQLHSLIREAACIAKCLCIYKHYNITIEVDKSLPNHVMGDERRFFQVLLHIVGNLLNGTNAGHLTFKVLSASETDVRWKTPRSNSSSDYVYIKFEICTKINRSQSEITPYTPVYCNEELEESLNFAVCRKLVHLMQGDIYVVPNSEGFDQSMTVIVGFQRQPSIPIGMSKYAESSDPTYPHSVLHGVEVFLADYDDMNRAVTRKMLEKLGCIVTVVSSGYECLSAVGLVVSSLQIILLDLHLPDVDGFELTLRLRKHRSHGWPLIIGLASTTDEDVRKCLQIGMNSIIRKPVLLRGLAEELQKVLLLPSRVMTFAIDHSN